MEGTTSRAVINPDGGALEVVTTAAGEVYPLLEGHQVTLIERNDYIGGHTHTLLEEPEIVEKAGDEPTIISQVGHGGVVLGRLNFEFTQTNRIRRAYVANQPIDKATDKLV